MKTLHLSSHLDVPIDVVTEKLAWIGVTGSGKSYGASKLAELLWDAHAQFVVLDPVGVWYGLRLAKDGKGAGIPIPVFGGLHGDVPLEATAGALVADTIVDRDLSAVVDVSQFESDADKARFVSAFADRLYQRRKRAPAAMHVFLEEAQEFVPQNPQPGEQMMLHRLHRMQKLGRNFGIGTSIITQRPQETSKKALNQAQTVCCFRLTGSQERKAIDAWITDKGLSQELLADLPKLETGTCHVWSPAFLRTFKTVRIAPKGTYDASATPKVGVRAAARELAPIDLAQLREAMKATIEKAKDEDPRLLRDRIRKLEASLSSRAATTAKIIATPAERIEIPVVKPAELKRVEAILARLEKLSEKTSEVNDVVIIELCGLVNQINKAVPAVGRFGCKGPMLPPGTLKEPIAQRLPPPWKSPIKTAGYKIEPFETKGEAAALKRHGEKLKDVLGLRIPMPNTERVLREAAEEAMEKVSGPSHRRVLNTIAYLARLGVMPAPRAQVAVLAGMTPNGGYYARIVGELKTAGLLGYPDDGMLGLTGQGEAMADPGKALQTSEAIQQDVLARLGPSHQRLMRELIHAFPRSLRRELVAEQAQMDAAGGYFARLVGELKTMGVVTYPNKGELRASDILFVREDATR